MRSLNWISTPEAAKILGCTRQHVCHLVRNGSLSGEQIGRDWLVDPESLRAWSSKKYRRRSSEVEIVAEPQVECLFEESDLLPITNVASVPHRSPFRYPGGKTWLLPMARLWMRSVAHGRKTLIEPFAGGATISLGGLMEGFFNRIALNEIDPDVAVVWSCIAGGDGLRLARAIREFQFTSDSVQEVISGCPSDAVGQAFRTIVRNRASRGGIMAPGAGLIRNGENGKGLASRWYPETLAKRLEALHGVRAQIEVSSIDGVSLIENLKAGGSGALFIDPPYTRAGRRLYTHHHLNHRELFAAVAKARYPFLATYDQSEEIAELAREYGFETRLIPMKSAHHCKKFELIICSSFEWLVSGSPASK